MKKSHEESLKLYQLTIASMKSEGITTSFLFCSFLKMGLLIDLLPQKQNFWNKMHH